MKLYQELKDFCKDKSVNIKFTKPTKTDQLDDVLYLWKTEEQKLSSNMTLAIPKKRKLGTGTIKLFF